MEKRLVDLQTQWQTVTIGPVPSGGWRKGGEPGSRNGKNPLIEDANNGKRVPPNAKCWKTATGNHITDSSDQASKIKEIQAKGGETINEKEDFSRKGALRPRVGRCHRKNRPPAALGRGLPALAGGRMRFNTTAKKGKKASLAEKKHE